MRVVPGFAPLGCSHSRVGACSVGRGMAAMVPFDAVTMVFINALSGSCSTGIFLSTGSMCAARTCASATSILPLPLCGPVADQYRTTLCSARVNATYSRRFESKKTSSLNSTLRPSLRMLVYSASSVPVGSNTQLSADSYPEATSMIRRAEGSLGKRNENIFGLLP